MSTNDPARRDARHCPRCGAMGILPLDQPAEVNGEIEDPVMICPLCEEEFRATGMRWLGAFDVADVTDEEIHDLAVGLVEWQDQISAQAKEQGFDPGRTSAPEDPFGAGEVSDLS